MDNYDDYEYRKGKAMQNAYDEARKVEAIQNLVTKAIGRDAHATAELWRALAEDCSSANEGDLRKWLQHIALRLVADVIGSGAQANRKAEAARRAVGLSGQIGNAALRMYVSEYDSLLEGFDAYDENGTPVPFEKVAPKWGDNVRLAMRAIKMGLVEGVDAGAAKQHIMNTAKRIERIRKGLE